MANASEHISTVVKEEGGYQASAADTGNYFNKQLLGTKYGITPAAYFDYYKKVPTLDTIKNLTVPQVVPIYKKNFWDKIRGDEIKNDSVAALMLFTVVNSGPGQVKPLKELMNATAGKKIVEPTTTPFTSAEVKLLNALPQDIYFKNLKAARERFYRDIAAKQPAKAIYLTGWLNRLNKHVYSGESSGGSKALKITGVLLGLGFAGYLWHRFG